MKRCPGTEPTSHLDEQVLLGGPRQPGFARQDALSSNVKLGNLPFEVGGVYRGRGPWVGFTGTKQNKAKLRLPLAQDLTASLSPYSHS